MRSLRRKRGYWVSKKVWFSRAWVDVKMVGASMVLKIHEAFRT